MSYPKVEKDSAQCLHVSSFLDNETVNVNVKFGSSVGLTERTTGAFQPLHKCE